VQDEYINVMLLTFSKFAKVLACFGEATGNDNEAWLQAPDTQALVAEVKSLVRKCKALAIGIKAARPTRCPSCPNFSFVPPPRSSADAMARLYFQSFESTYRILHAPSFWSEYSQYWDDPGNVKMAHRLKIFLVIAIGSSLLEHNDKEAEFRSTVHQWIYAAQTWLSGPLEKDRVNVVGLQIQCLTILARQIFSLGGELTWTSIGSLTHLAMQIGLHRDPKHFPAMSVLQAELRRRLWATVLEMIVQSSLGSGMPPRFAFDEFDTELPSNSNDHEIDDSTTVLQPHPKDEYTTMSIQIALCGSLRTRHTILQLLNRPSPEISYKDVIRLSTEIIKACRTCSFLTNQTGRSTMTPFHRNLLDYHIRRFLLPLNCPFSCRTRANPLFYYSRKLSVDAAVALVSPEPDEGFARLMTIGGGMFREGLRYAAIAVSLELIAQAEAQCFDMTLHRNHEYRGLLKRILQKMVSSFTERIRYGETNVKMHAFVSMVLAQAESIETGTLCEHRIALGGRDSLRFCHDLLQAQAGSVSSSWCNELDVSGLDDEYAYTGMDLDTAFSLQGAGSFFD
jgi:hypothetical protein